MRRCRTPLLIALIGLGGCGGGATSSISRPLGRALTSGHFRLSPPAAPVGDPPEERNGAVRGGQATAENRPAPESIAPSPQAALRRYALTYVNWHASSLRAHQQRLASLTIGAARLAAEQTAASESGAASLAADHVQSNGAVLAIAPGEGPARGQWVVVTQEQTTGAGPYAGLPSFPHVTLARATRLRSGWVVSEWNPRS